MAQANLVTKKVRMGHRDVIKYQIMTYCFIHDLQLSSSELSCLTLLGAYGECDLSKFCDSAVEEKIFKTPQTVRNFLTKASKMKLVRKHGSSKKKINLNEEMQVQTAGNIILDYKMVYVAQEQ